MEVELLCAETTHHRVEDAELEGGECPNHDTTCSETLGAKLDDTRLLRDVQHARWDRAVATSTGLVHFRQQRVCRMRNDRGDNTSNHTRTQGDGGVEDSATICWLRVHVLVHCLSYT